MGACRVARDRGPGWCRAGHHSSNETTYKVRNLRRDPRAALCVFVEAFRGPWIQIEGTATIVTLPDAMEPLVDYYRRLAGNIRIGTTIAER